MNKQWGFLKILQNTDYLERGMLIWTHDTISEVAYALHLQFPENQAEYNWHLAKKLLNRPMLVVGETYITTGNYEVTIESKYNELYIGSNRLAYTSDGCARSDKRNCQADIAYKVLDTHKQKR